MELTTYEPGDKTAYIPIEKWGEDHWSTLAYLETCAVDQHGNIDNRRMRCNPRLHRGFTHSASFSGNPDAYPTQLHSGVEHNHDDWSCAEDMVASGLIALSFWTKQHGETFGHQRGIVTLTDLGMQMASLLRQHKASDGVYGNFKGE